MNKAIIGKKLGMTQVFMADGTMVPVTVVKAGPCTVVQKKTQETLGQGNGATQTQAANKSKENSGYKITTYNNNMNKISDKKKKKDKDF